MLKASEAPATVSYTSPMEDSGDSKPDSAKAPQSTGPEPAPKRKLTVAVLPLLAMALSIVSLLLSIRNTVNVAKVDAIKTQYGLFQSLAQTQVQYPMMSHLFVETPGAYQSQRETIQVATSSSTDAERAKLLLLERALAHYIFTTFEETYYLSKQARDGERSPAPFLDENLQFFDEFLCANPRLRWYWDKKGGQLSAMFAQELRDHYRSIALKACSTDEPPDADGPFAPRVETTRRGSSDRRTTR
jgi:hypothetical protein